MSISFLSMLHPTFRATPAASPERLRPCLQPTRAEIGGTDAYGHPDPSPSVLPSILGGAKSPLVFRCLAARNIEPAGSHDVAAGRSPGFSHRSGNVVPLCCQLISRLLLLGILIWSLLPGSNTDLRTHIVYQADSGTDFSSRGKAESPALFADLTK